MVKEKHQKKSAHFEVEFKILSIPRGTVSKGKSSILVAENEKREGKTDSLQNFQKCSYPSGEKIGKFRQCCYFSSRGIWTFFNSKVIVSLGRNFLSRDMRTFEFEKFKIPENLRNFGVSGISLFWVLVGIFL